ncbi:putative isomerase yddE, PhzC-PhzF family [Lunatimonas lonarensis]|uniref:Putative isomerase yddE, PhzC-PhzF family n=1 Tax=Lunatimonas lonarensis TaxID=1232681 RepID=R7ZY78_9BACT|nr:PhzF family phenazine biosynthesis protein [Lunatimonas lonarensis]EON79032.1 putative isomerase yddE, PhzC-PhzF family [Lunatimonas lonarensis]
MENIPSNIPVYAVFTDPLRGFKGNPAAVVESETPIPAADMQQLAALLGQPATTFLVRSVDNPSRFDVRWFAPDEEIGLCGHGAAAAGAYLGQKYAGLNRFELVYGSGEMEVRFQQPGMVSLLLQAIPIKQEIPVPRAIKEGLGIPILAMYETGNKHLIRTDLEESVRTMVPDFERLRDADLFGYAVTAPGIEVDFVSRTLVPHVQQLEDYATGSSHAMLASYWGKQLNKSSLLAHQLSSRGGAFRIQLTDNTVELTGHFLIER